MSEIKKIKEQYLLKLDKVLDQNKLNEIKTEFEWLKLRWPI